MKRWLLTGVVASVAWGGSASGQTTWSAAPPAAPAAPVAPAAQAGDGTIIMKTAGQPDRRVKVLRSDRMPDGKVLTEVKDLASGEIYTITDTAPGGSLDTAPRPTTPAAQRPILGKVFGAKDAKDAPPPRAKDRPADPLLAGRPADGTPTPAPAAEQKPRLFGRVFGKSTPAADPVVAAPAGRPVVPPARPATAAPAMPPAFQQATPAGPVAQGPIQASMTEQQSIVPEEQMRREIAQYMHDLQNHPRPSFRMEAATGLCDGRYASREETKRAVATAVVNDPAGVVRGHCIDCLSKLGYADPEYVRRLQLWANDPEPAVQRAAREALAKLTPKP